MTKDRQETIRLLVPGALALLVVRSLFSSFDPGAALGAIELKAWSRVFLIAVVIGAAYKIFEGWRLVLKGWQKRVRDTIYDGLLAVPRTVALSDEQKMWLRQSGGLMSLFYNIVDGDDSLKLKRDGVYENGAIVTTAADVVVFSLAGVFLHALLVAILQNAQSRAWGIYYGVIFLVVHLWILPAAERRHIRLSNEQLRVISDLHTDAVEKGIKELLQRMPP